MEDEWGTHYPIDSDPDNSAAYYSIKIKTKTDDNESKVIAMTYLNTAGYKSGRIKIDVGLNKVWIDFCQKVSEQLPDHSPTDAEKVWNIVRTAQPRMVVYCNGVEVFNLLLSDEKCPYDRNNAKWSDYWKGDVIGVKFDPIDRSLIAGYMLGKSQCWQVRPSPLHSLYYYQYHLLMADYYYFELVLLFCTDPCQVE